MKFIHAGIDKGGVTRIVFLGVQKTFDGVWYVELLQKFNMDRAAAQLIKIYEEYLKLRFFIVRVRIILSNRHISELYD